MLDCALVHHLFIVVPMLAADQSPTPSWGSPGAIIYSSSSVTMSVPQLRRGAVVMIKCDRVVVLDTDVRIRNDMDDQLLRCISFGAVGTAGAMRQGEVAGQHLEPNPT